MRRATSFFLRVLFSVVVVGGIVLTVGSPETWKPLAQLSPGIWASSLVGFCIIHFGCAMKWRYTVHSFGSTLTTSDALRAHGIGLAGNFLLPSIVGGDLLRTGMVLGRTRRAEGLVLGSLTDRVLDVAALGVLFVVGAWLRRDERAEIALLAIIGAFLGCILAIKAAAAMPWTRGLPVRFRRHGSRLRVAVRRVDVARLAWGLGFSIVLQGALLLVNMRMASVMGLPDDASAWLIAWSGAKIAAMLPISFGGLGVREAAWAALAEPLGFAKAPAVAQSLAWQSVLMAGGVLGGAASVLIGFVKRREVKG